jgi:hypothetical protein
VSPAALARHVLAQVEKGSRSVTAGAFQLTELVVMLRSVAAQAPKDVDHYEATCEQARLEVETMLRRLREKHAEELSPKSAFARYAGRLSEVQE